MGSMSRWLDVEAGADDIDINTLPSNVTFSDLQNDNEAKLIIGDFGRSDDGPRLKVRSPNYTIILYYNSFYSLSMIN